MPFAEVGVVRKRPLKITGPDIGGAERQSDNGTSHFPGRFGLPFKRPNGREGIAGLESRDRKLEKRSGPLAGQ